MLECSPAYLGVKQQYLLFNLSSNYNHLKFQNLRKMIDDVLASADVMDKSLGQRVRTLARCLQCCEFNSLVTYFRIM